MILPGWLVTDGHQSRAVICEALRRAKSDSDATSQTSNGLSLSIRTKYCRDGDSRRPRMKVGSGPVL